jgi:hypothetical protein
MDSPGRHEQWEGPDADTLACIRRTVEAWPPLTAEQCDRIALLLRPEPGEARPGGGVGRLDPGTLEPLPSGGEGASPALSLPPRAAMP